MGPGRVDLPIEVFWSFSSTLRDIPGNVDANIPHLSLGYGLSIIIILCVPSDCIYLTLGELNAQQNNEYNKGRNLL